jgi:tRNA(Glu) U13 pseudouridine synthase TruD
LNEISQKIAIGWTNFATVAMEIKKGDLKKNRFFIKLHETS